MTQHARERPVPARVWMAAARLGQAAVRPGHGEGMLHDAFHVLFIEHMVDAGGAAFLDGFHDQLGAIFRGWLQVLHHRPVMQRLALQFGLPFYAAKLYPPQVAAAPVIDDVEHNLLLDFGSHLRILKPPQKSRRATGTRPGRHQDGDARVGCRVGILVHHDINAFLARGIHHGQCRAALAPHWLADHLVVREYDGQFCLAPNLNGFLH